jgi:hypothetical protein
LLGVLIAAYISIIFSGSTEPPFRPFQFVRDQLVRKLNFLCTQFLPRAFVFEKMFKICRTSAAK